MFILYPLCIGQVLGSFFFPLLFVIKMFLKAHFNLQHMTVEAEELFLSESSHFSCAVQGQKKIRSRATLKS